MSPALIVRRLALFARAALVDLELWWLRLRCRMIGGRAADQMLRDGKWRR